MENQLHDKIAVIKEKAIAAGEDIIFDFTADGGSVIVANKSRGYVGLISTHRDGSVCLFDVSIAKWRWAKTEGFSTDQMANGELRKEIFKPIKTNELIRKLTGE